MGFFFFLLYTIVKVKKKLIKHFASFGIESMHGRWMPKITLGIARNFGLGLRDY